MSDPKPVLRVLDAGATPEEVAAVVLVLTALQTPGRPTGRRPSEWSAPGRRLRTALPHGPGAWRASGLPR